MRQKISFLVSLIMLCLLPVKLNATQEILLPDPEVTISMDFQDAGLKDILKILSIQSGLNFIASESVQDRKITLFIDKVPLAEVMDKLFKANNLSYELEEDSNIFIVKDWGKPETERVTKIFYLKYATVSSSSLKEEISSHISTASTTSETSSGSDSSSGSSGGSGKWKVEEESGITQAIKKNLSSYGSVIEDFRTNSLIVTDIPSKMVIIERLIASLDVSVAQVMLEVEMLDVSKNIVDKLGFDFSQNPITLFVPGSFGKTRFFLGDMTYRSKTFSDAAGSVIFGRTYAEVLDFLRTQTDTKFLARPRLLTLNNETAEIKITTQESIGVTTTTEASTGTTAAEPERSETGVSLRITPQINMDTGEITMFIYPQVSEATAGNTLTSGGQSYQFRDPEVRSTKSVVRINDNQTVILGGLIRNEFYQTTTKLPILGDLPLIGALFRHKGGSADKNKERELLVFITPHIVKEAGMSGVAAAKKAKMPLREQGGASMLQRQANISKALSNFEKGK